MLGIGVQFRGARMPHSVGGTLPQDQCVELAGGACRRVRTAQLYGCAQNSRPPLHTGQRVLGSILLPGAAQQGDGAFPLRGLAFDPGKVMLMPQCAPCGKQGMADVVMHLHLHFQDFFLPHNVGHIVI